MGSEGYIDGKRVFLGLLVIAHECYWKLCYVVCQPGKFCHGLLITTEWSLHGLEILTLEYSLTSPATHAFP